MSIRPTVAIEGAKEIEKILKMLPKSIQSKIAKRALRDAGKKVAAQVKRNAPVFVGTLKRQIKSKANRPGKDGASQRVFINWRGIRYFEDGFYPAYVEYGTKNGVKAQKYMERAYKSEGPGVRDQLEKDIVAGIEAEVEKLGRKGG